MIPPGFTIESSHSKISDSFATIPMLDDDALARKKLLATTSFSALSRSGVAPPQATGATGGTAAPAPSHAAFRGLFVVQSATEARHVKYAMEVVSPELQLHVRVTQRFSAFYLLRKRLLQALKKCQDEAARPSLLQRSSSLFDLEHTLRRPCCAGCAHVRKVLKRAPFPRRALVFTTVEDVDARAPRLEAFLSECVRLVSDWPGCVRGRQFACVVLGQFLSMNLLFHVFQQLRLTIAEANVAAEAAALAAAEQADETPNTKTKTETPESEAAPVVKETAPAIQSARASNQLEAV